jgi:glycosyltransferase involved in cell wall biosynthesis
VTRVALVCDWFLPRLGGIELHLRDLAIALRHRGMDARVVTTTRGADMVDGVPVHRVPAALAPGAGFAFTPAALAGVAAAIARERFDVVHAHASVVSPVAYAGALAGARGGRSTVLTFHSMLYNSAFLLGASEALLGWSRERIVLSAVSSVVAGQATRWLPDASVAILPNGVDAGFWRAGGRAPATPRSGEVLFVTAMRLSRKKRPARLLRAFATACRLVNGVPPMRLLLAGDGPDRVALSRLAASLGIADRVELLGQLSRDELRQLHARADAFVLPSERESFGLAALEARAAGLPVIAMLASGARDFIQQGVNGLLARDERELAGAIGRLALDAPFRAYVARQNASSPPPYDWSDVAALHERVYAAAAGLRAGVARASHQ